MYEEYFGVDIEQPNIVEFGNEDKVCWSTREEIVLMQYTGLKDKNGKEIYEGDIVELNITYWNNCNKEYVEEEREFIGEITDFRGLGWSIRYKDKDNNIDYPMMWLLGKDYTIEVKGNIYENQELLG